MRLNADFSQRVALQTGELPWQPSPDGSVERRMLDRIGTEVARATSIVRYPPGSRFPPHEHGLGEEFLVLEGVFSDEHGDYPRHTYVRNPPGSRHAPGSEAGCVIFVKLRQFQDDDARHVVVGPDRAWRPSDLPGLTWLPLHAHGLEEVRLLRLAAGFAASGRAAPNSSSSKDSVRIRTASIQRAPG
jgi:anti-sigma factor ChrR (cupin superfamily)